MRLYGWVVVLGVAVLWVGAGACVAEDPDDFIDGGPQQDAGEEIADAGQTQDAGPELDAGNDDAGTDAGSDPTDAGADAGTPPTYDLTCLGVPLPATAAAGVTVSGTVRGVADASGPAPLGNATVKAFARGNATALATTTSSSTGAFSLSFDTPGTPVDGYLEITAGSYVDGYVYPATPVAEDRTLDALLLRPQVLGAIASLAEVDQANGNGVLIVQVSDCAGTPIDGATVTAKSSGSDVGTPYTPNDPQQPGVTLFFNVPPGVVTVGASFDGNTLRAHDVDVRADALTATAVVP